MRICPTDDKTTKYSQQPQATPLFPLNFLAFTDTGFHPAGWRAEPQGSSLASKPRAVGLSSGSASEPSHACTVSLVYICTVMDLIVIFKSKFLCAGHHSKPVRDLAQRALKPKIRNQQYFSYASTLTGVCFSVIDDHN